MEFPCRSPLVLSSVFLSRVLFLSRVSHLALSSLFFIFSPFLRQERIYFGLRRSPHVSRNDYMSGVKTFSLDYFVIWTLLLQEPWAITLILENSVDYAI